MIFWLRRTLLISLILGALPLKLFADDKVITWATNPNYPPYDWSIDENSYAGACIELLSLIAPKGYVFSPVVVPWVRAQTMAKRGEIDMLVNIRITPERSTWLKFSTNPTFANPIVVFMKKDKQIPFKSWDELKPLHGGITLGDAFGNGFDEYLNEHLDVEAIQNVRGNFLKLNTGRIDYFVSGYYLGMSILSRAGFKQQIVALNPPISNTSIHLGFSKRSRHLDVLPEIDRKLAELAADGTLNRMIDAYLKKYLESSPPVFSE